MRAAVAIILIHSFSLFSLEYSINLSWIYRDINDSEKYVFPEKHRGIDLMSQLKAWEEKNPKAPINIWYDSDFVTPEQVQNTENILRELNMERLGKYALRIKNLREFQDVKENPAVFSKQTPTYFRSDLTRILATYVTVTACIGICYFVYVDWDVTPMTKDDLFLQDTLNKIAKFGMVLKEEGSNHDMENSLHIVSNQVPNLLK